MKGFKTYIVEKLRINKNTNINAPEIVKKVIESIKENLKEKLKFNDSLYSLSWNKNDHTIEYNTGVYTDSVDSKMTDDVIKDVLYENHLKFVINELPKSNSRKLIIEIIEIENEGV